MRPNLKGRPVDARSFNAGSSPNMVDLRQSRSLAAEIGSYHIALVVNAVFNQMKTRPAFASLFDVRESHDDEKACLTYFWWIVLGGNKLSDLDSEVIRGCGRMAFSPRLLSEWLEVFRETAVPIIGAELTDAWLLRAVQVSHEFPATKDVDAVQLVQRVSSSDTLSTNSNKNTKGLAGVEKLFENFPSGNL